MVGCHLELMGLPDQAAFRRLARGVLQTACARKLVLGLNVPNKKPGEPLLEWAETLRHELPHIEICVHYSLKHQRGKNDTVDMFHEFCQRATSLGIARVLLVTGPRGPRLDAVQVLEEISRRQLSLGTLKIGVAFNACLPSEEERREEQQRLIRKLNTGIVQEVWLNCGDNIELLDIGISFVRAASASVNATQIQLFGSVLLPNPAQLQQMRDRPWGGVHFSREYLSSLEEMDRCTRNVLQLYGVKGIQPIVESKVRNGDDVDKLEFLLQALTDAHDRSDHIEIASSMKPCKMEFVGDPPFSAVAPQKSVLGRRWGSGRLKTAAVEEQVALK
mmetsp:Transcript_25301/g.39983  ORF Transcript_25301/g.39983 Transcript_25301/m.39983 type:complete len:332 (+) Transcript_25301:79-1074(+)